jgi:hypothetical protein
MQRQKSPQKLPPPAATFPNFVRGRAFDVSLLHSRKVLFGSNNRVFQKFCVAKAFTIRKGHNYTAASTSSTPGVFQMLSDF